MWLQWFWSLTNKFILLMDLEKKVPFYNSILGAEIDSQQSIAREFQSVGRTHMCVHLALDFRLGTGQHFDFCLLKKNPKHTTSPFAVSLCSLVDVFLAFSEILTHKSHMSNDIVKQASMCQHIVQ